MLPTSSDNLIVKQTSNMREFLVYEELLAHSIRPVISELYMVNAGAMVGYIFADQKANIDDIVSSSTELLLKPGRLRSGRAASVDLEWGQLPAVSISMEFHHASLIAFFRIVFEDRFVGIDIEGILYSEVMGDAEENRRRLAYALADARAHRA